MLVKRWVLKNVLGRLAGVIVGQACGWAGNLIKTRKEWLRRQTRLSISWKYRGFLDGSEVGSCLGWAREDWG
jgi:hypothetical protein